jgi:two-component system phosphate regulon sensor histidine kinase PhoR
MPLRFLKPIGIPENGLLATTWRSIAGFTLIGLGLAILFLSVRSSLQKQQWQTTQERIAASDLEAICRILQANPDALAEPKSSGVPLLEDARVSSTIDLFVQGELVWGDSQDSQSQSKQQPQNKSGNVLAVWSTEPNQYLRLRIARNQASQPTLPNQVSGYDLALIRRFSAEEVDRLLGWDWFLAACILGLACCSGLLVSLAGHRRLELISSLRDWSQKCSVNLGKVQLKQATAPLQRLDPVVFQVVERVWSEANQRLLAIQQSADQSSRVMFAMPVGVLAFDHQLKLIFVNRAGRELLGLSEAVRLGQSLIEVVRFPPVVRLIQKTSDDQLPEEAEIEIPMSKATLRLRTHPLKASNSDDPNTQSSGILITVTDETRLKILENARRDFTANVSHELKTPLSAIKAYSETLLIGALEDPEASRRFVERISEQAHRLDVLIRDLLHLTKLQSQPDKPPLTSLKIEDVLKTCVEEHRTIGGAKNISIDIKEVDGECRVKADLESLRTVLSNLLGNAVRYNRPGGWVRVSTQTEPGKVLIKVTDSGIGIPPEDLDRVFERFYRVEKARSQDAGGTGLGLAIVKHLVQAMQADIVVRSELGKGSEFELRLQSAEP